MDGRELDAALLAAHGQGDRTALVTLYIKAADGVVEAEAKAGAEAFFLTHAYVFALEAGDRRAAVLRARLVALGAEVPEG